MRHENTQSPRKNGIDAFTLIELLVVITIIVVLLALLTPALDQAIYQAELVVCAASQHGIATGAGNYAVNYRRRYPYREESSFSNGGDSLEPPRLVTGAETGQNGDPERDVRLIAEDFINVRFYNDPLSPEVDFSVSANDFDTFIYANYNLWFSFRYIVGQGNESGMMKLGDRWSWTDTSGGEPVRYRFDYLVGEWAKLNTGGSEVQNSHHDKAGVMAEFANQNVRFATIRFKATGSGWASLVTNQRGPVDMNNASADGSVARFNDMLWDDERLILTPHWHDSTRTKEAIVMGGEGGNWWVQVPK